jgi:hypothetical protein
MMGWFMAARRFGPYFLPAFLAIFGIEGEFLGEEEGALNIKKAIKGSVLS